MKQGATVRAYDPAAIEEAVKAVRACVPCKDAYDAAQGADALVLMTEWNQFRTFDLPKIKAALRQPLFLTPKCLRTRPDGRHWFPSHFSRTPHECPSRPIKWPLTELFHFRLLFFDLRLIAHSIEHLHDTCLQAVVGFPERRG